MKKTIKSVAMAALCCAFMISSCSKEYAPKPKGTLVSYTMLSTEDFDRIDILVDGQQLGQLSKPNDDKPVCWEKNSASVSSISLDVGNHMVGAKQYKEGKLVGEWPEEPLTIEVESCRKIKWN
jgi:hypothetical protein